MTTWTDETANDTTFTPESLTSPPVDEANLLIGGGFFLEIGGGFKLIIQPANNGTAWTPEPIS